MCCETLRLWFQLLLDRLTTVELYIMAKTKKLPKRSEVKAADTWDLGSLFQSDAAWETAFTKWEKQIPQFEKFRGTLAESPAALAKCLKFDSEFDRAGEQLGNYAFLKTAEDTANSEYQRMVGRYQHAATNAAEAASFIRPEILAIAGGEAEEVSCGEAAGAVSAAARAAGALQAAHAQSRRREAAGDAERDGGRGGQDVSPAHRRRSEVRHGQEREGRGGRAVAQHVLSRSCIRPIATCGAKAFHQYYEQFKGHENTLAAALSSSVQKDVYYAKVRGYASAREASLFHDNVPVSVYDNLISAVHGKLPALYRYFELRRRKMKLRDIHHYDTYVPILSELDQRHTWNQAVEVVVESLEPLGDDYCRVLGRGFARPVVRSLPEPGQAERRV